MIQSGTHHLSREATSCKAERARRQIECAMLARPRRGTQRAPGMPCSAWRVGTGRGERGVRCDSTEYRLRPDPQPCAGRHARGWTLLALVPSAAPCEGLGPVVRAVVVARGLVGPKHLDDEDVEALGTRLATDEFAVLHHCVASGHEVHRCIRVALRQHKFVGALGWHPAVLGRAGHACTARSKLTQLACMRPSTRLCNHRGQAHLP